MRIGILGGSFDPVHQGHAALARGALKELKLDRLFLLPSKRNPLKSEAPAVSAAARLRLLRLAFRGVPHCAVSGLELRRRGPSYTVDSVRAFRRKFPRAELFLILGEDAFRGFRSWKDWRSILALCTPAVASRGGRSASDPYLRKKALRLKSPMPGASSTRIREDLRAGQRPAGLAPAVRRDIRRHRLYHG